MDLSRTLKRLAAATDPTASTVTLTLDLSASGRLPAATRLFLKDQVYGNLASEARPESAQGFLRKLSRRLRDFVEKGVRPETDGLYLAAGPDLWEAVELRLPLRNQIVVGRTPYLAPLLDALRRAPRAYAVTVKAREIRIDELLLGERREVARIAATAPDDDVEHAVAIGGGAERDLHQRRWNAAGKAMAKAAAARIVALQRGAPAEWIIASDRAFREALPAPLRERVVEGRLDRAIAARIAGEVETFQAARAEGLRTALGARDALEALARGDVERVYVDPDDPVPGVICTTCASRFPELHRRCPWCEGDVVAASMTQEVVAQALAHPSLGLTFVKAAWLKDLGGLAALLVRKRARRSRTADGAAAR